MKKWMVSIWSLAMLTDYVRWFMHNSIDKGTNLMLMLITCLLASVAFAIFIKITMDQSKRNGRIVLPKIDDLPKKYQIINFLADAWIVASIMLMIRPGETFI